MIITLKDGSKKEYSEAKSVIDVAFDISEGLARAACAGEVDGEVVDLRTVLDKDCELNILTARDEKGLAVLRHTASHVMAEAVQTLFPEAKVAIGPSIDTGFYYDFECQSFSRDDLDAIEKEMKKIAEGKNFTACDFGKLNDLGGYVLQLGDIKIPGKVFGGQAVGATGGDFSFQIYQPGQEGGFYHTHKNHEELYFVLSGKGEYQVDGVNIPLQEGSVVRVAPAGKRTIHNNGSEPLVVLCVQYRGATFSAEDATDGVILQDQVEW